MTPAERNRAEFPEFARIMDELRAAGGAPKMVWASYASGYSVGPVPDGWADIFEDTKPPQPAPVMGYRGTRSDR